MPSASVLDAVGNTPMVELHNVVPRGSARVLAKLGSGASVITLLADSGIRYMSTDLFAS